MVSTTAVKRALNALATRTDTATRPYVAVIDEAEAARTDLRRAAAFVDSVGLERLAEAVTAAESDGHVAAAERGRAALAAYRAFREAAAGGERRPTTGERGAATGEREAATGEREAATGKREAVTGEREAAAGGDREGATPADRGATTGERNHLPTDHFRSAPGTPKSDTGQLPGR